jgi:putative hemolysin
MILQKNVYNSIYMGLVLMGLLFNSSVAVAEPNPSSVYCVDQGYQLGGEGCLFPDGSSCDTWAFYRGQCGQKFTDCEKDGNKIKNVVKDVGSETIEYAVCVFPDGKECPEADYSTSKCKQSKSSDNHNLAFSACYIIGDALRVPVVLGAPSFKVHLFMYPSTSTVTGVGHISQGSIYPPLNMATKLEGQYFSPLIMGAPSEIDIFAIGYPLLHWSCPPAIKFCGVGPVLLPNVKLSMSLEPDLKSGTANFQYRQYDLEPGSKWVHINNTLVKSVPCISIMDK